LINIVWGEKSVGDGLSMRLGSLLFYVENLKRKGRAHEKDKGASSQKRTSYQKPII